LYSPCFQFFPSCFAFSYGLTASWASAAPFNSFLAASGGEYLQLEVPLPQLSFNSFLAASEEYEACFVHASARLRFQFFPSCFAILQATASAVKLTFQFFPSCFESHIMNVGVELEGGISFQFFPSCFENGTTSAQQSFRTFNSFLAASVGVFRVVVFKVCLLEF